jgi:hypothetical protein
LHLKNFKNPQHICMKRKLLLATLSIWSCATLWANNITVSTATLTGQNTSTHTVIAGFDLAWENSWRTSTNESNYDGAWIFIKYRKNGTTDWRHCTLSGTGFTPASGAAISIPADGKGAFVYRNANGIGNVNFTGNQVVWNYGADGLLDNETVELRVFALEMVYITQGAFYLGSGGAELNAFKNGAGPAAYQVSSNGAITLGTSTGQLNPNGMGTASGTVPAAFPKGFNAFWVMKYETSQQQYVDFLNHLDLARATANYYTLAVFGGTHPNLTAAQPERAIMQLNTSKISALADWSGLRPMTEMEFEKACRGYNTPPVPNEFAWGNTSNTPISTVNNAGLPNESVATPATANCNLASPINSAIRVGIFARPSGSTRTLSGGTYYGVMEMTGNETEVVVTIVNAQGLAITESVHGDGYLDNTGKTDILPWRAFEAYGTRGGAYNSPAAEGTVSARAATNLFAGLYGYDADLPSNAGRLVRTAP